MSSRKITDILPGRREQPPEIFCPGCGRFIGALRACPYCDAPAASGVSLRFLRRAAVLLAVCGLALLYMAARNREVPSVAADGITPMMNFAFVSVEGTVVARPYVKTENDKVSRVWFRISDGAGTVQVVAYGRAARAIAGRGIPEKGDMVKATGFIDASEQSGPKLRLQSAEGLIRLERLGE